MFAVAIEWLHFKTYLLSTNIYIKDNEMRIIIESYI